ncbi:hypothetical protein [Solihabitans fulvus]|nr:hypothetical protein [Solihabitans fulvus]
MKLDFFFKNEKYGKSAQVNEERVTEDPQTGLEHTPSIILKDERIAS